MQWKERSRAAAWHLTGSLLAVVLAATLVFALWYPYPYREVSGGRDLFRLIMSADVLIGPFLTFSVFDRRKSRSVLKRDLMCIVLMQLGALSIGIYVSSQARPVYLVHEVDRFRVVTAAEIDPRDLPAAKPAYRRIPLHGIRVIGVRKARDGVEFARLLDSALAGKDVSLIPELWQELDERNFAEIRERSRDITVLRARAGDGGQALNQLLVETGVPAEQVIALPMLGRRDDWSVIMDRRDLRILGYLPIYLF